MFAAVLANARSILAATERRARVTDDG